MALISARPSELCSWLRHDKWLLVRKKVESKGAAGRAPVAVPTVKRPQKECQSGNL